MVERSAKTPLATVLAPFAWVMTDIQPGRAAVGRTEAYIPAVGENYAPWYGHKAVVLRSVAQTEIDRHFQLALASAGEAVKLIDALNQIGVRHMQLKDVLEDSVRTGKEGAAVDVALDIAAATVALIAACLSDHGLEIGKVRHESESVYGPVESIPNISSQH